MLMNYSRDEVNERARGQELLKRKKKKRKKEHRCTSGIEHVRGAMERQGSKN